MMGEIRVFPLSSVEQAAWAVQGLLILMSLRRQETLSWLPRASIATCLLAISLGWAWRLSYLFALSSGGFKIWIGDAAVRWRDAYSWSEGAPLDFDSPWLPATTLLHGSAMGLLGDPLIASKLVSASYSLLPLVGIFLLSHAMFRSSLFACLCIVFAAPAWLHIRLGAGTMTEMPLIGLSLSGVALLIHGLGEGPGRRRGTLLALAALCLGLSATFHMVGWLLLAGILPCLLVCWMHMDEPAWYRRLGGWLIFSVTASAYPIYHLARLWHRTGSAFSQADRLADLRIFKLGTRLDLLPALSSGLDATSGAIYTTALLATGVLVATAWARRSSDPWAAAAREWLGGRRAQRIERGSWVAIALSGIASLWAWLHFGSPLRFLDLGALGMNAAIYPLSLAFDLRFLLPLTLFGVLHAAIRRDPESAVVRAVLVGVGVVLLVMVGTAIVGGTNVSPFRTVLPLAAALLPVALAPIVPAAFSSRRGAQPISAGRFAAQVALLGVLATLGIVANHQKILASGGGPPRAQNADSAALSRVARGEGPRGADVKSLGVWLRTESLGTGRLSEENKQHPFYLWIPNRGVGFLYRIRLEYEIGNPGWTSGPEQGENRPPIETAVAGLARGQVLISPEAVAHSRLEEITRIGGFWIYEAKGRARRHRRRAAALRQRPDRQEEAREVEVGEE